MKARIDVEVTVWLDLETLDKDVQLKISTDDPVPKPVVMAAALGGARSAVQQLEELQ